jgi:hypothetical protein
MEREKPFVYLLFTKKRLRCYQRVIAAQPLIPVNRRSDPGGLAISACTRESRLFLYPDQCASGRRASGRHSEQVFTRSFAFPEGDAVPFGFCCGGFSSTAYYVSGNEAQAFAQATYATPEADHLLQSATRFYPGACKQAFRLQRRASIATANRLLLPSNGASPRHPPIPSLVTIPLRTATGCGLYTLLLRTVNSLSGEIVTRLYASSDIQSPTGSCNDERRAMHCSI